MTSTEFQQLPLSSHPWFSPACGEEVGHIAGKEVPGFLPGPGQDTARQMVVSPESLQSENRATLPIFLPVHT